MPLIFSRPFFELFALLVFLANTRGAALRYSKRDQKKKIRNEKHGFVTSFSVVSLYVFLLLISFGVTLTKNTNIAKTFQKSGVTEKVSCATHVI